MLTLNGLIGIMAQPHILAATGTGRNETACRIGFTYGTFIKRFCTVAWALVGLLVLALPAVGGLEQASRRAVESLGDGGGSFLVGTPTPEGRAPLPLLLHCDRRQSPGRLTQPGRRRQWRPPAATVCSYRQVTGAATGLSGRGL